MGKKSFAIKALIKFQTNNPQYFSLNIAIFENMQTVHLLISGKVQGVFFRETSRKVAEKLNIKGWIQNTADEKVEALITGEENEVNDFIKWCKTGPDRAEVKEVIVLKQPETFFKSFEVKRRK